MVDDYVDSEGRAYCARRMSARLKRVVKNCLVTVVKFRAMLRVKVSMNADKSTVVSNITINDYNIVKFCVLNGFRWCR